MSAFRLVLAPDGRAILTTERPLERDQVSAIREAFEEWRQSSAGLAIIGDCGVVQVVDVELELPDSVEVPA